MEDRQIQQKMASLKVENLVLLFKNDFSVDLEQIVCFQIGVVESYFSALKVVCWTKVLIWN
jgi:hypothetical protein